MERTLVLVKPDGVQRGLIGEIIGRLERRGLRLVAAKFIQVSQELAETHYAIHKGKLFYNGLIKYITSAPVMAMVWEGPNAVVAIRPGTVGRLQRLLDIVEGGDISLVVGIVMPIRCFGIHDRCEELFCFLIGIRTRLELPLVRHMLFLLLL